MLSSTIQNTLEGKFIHEKWEKKGRETVKGPSVAMQNDAFKFWKQAWTTKLMASTRHGQRFVAMKLYTKGLRKYLS